MTTLSRGPYQHGKALYESIALKSSDSSSKTAAADTEFNNALHLKYWRRCFKSLLPNAYQSNDSTRMTLAFFTLSSLDLLGEGADKLPAKERNGYKDWILSCQHPITGGFCGSPNHRLPDSAYEGTQNGKKPDFEPASLTATFFAMLNLNYVGSITQANRTGMWKWLKTLQRKDGSFGEMVTAQGEIYGSRDMRICLCAAAVRWMLRLDPSFGERKDDDIDVDALVKHITNSEAYDGAVGETSQLESHAGYTYCAIAALSYLDRLPPCITNPWTSPADGYKLRGLTKLDDTIRWCMMRQVTILAHESGKDDGSSDDEDSEGATEEELKKKEEMADSVTNLRALTRDHKQYIGCNGRLNKDPDTCYSFWVGASLDMMGQNVLIDREGCRRWLMKKTQHMIGGFGKMPGHPPDIYHSYMGLAALSVYNTTGLLPLDSALAISQASKAKLEADMKRLCKPKTYPSLLREYKRIEPDPEPEKAEDAEKPEGDVSDKASTKSSQKSSEMSDGKEKGKKKKMAEM